MDGKIVIGETVNKWFCKLLDNVLHNSDVFQSITINILMIVFYFV